MIFGRHIEPGMVAAQSPGEREENGRRIRPAAPAPQAQQT
jgi:hypothetical protein